MNKTTLSLLFVFTALLSNAQILNEDSNQPVKSIGEIVSTDTLVMRSTTSSAGNLTENLVTSYNFAPSPEAHALMQYSDIPVSLYTGVPEISIPIYTISVGDYNLPLKLQYHASGIKVSQEASRVGLGWSLHAGGCISRIIQGRDDFDEYGFYYCSDTIPESYSDGIIPNSNISNEELDLESDIYCYNFAGYSGKFVVKKGEYATDDTERFMSLNPDDNLRIEGYEGEFRIITEDNTQYIFDEIETRRMCNMVFSGEGGGSHYNESLYPNRTFIPLDETYFSQHYTNTSWSLSKIILQNGEEINFYYDEIYNSYLSPVHETYSEYKVLDSVELDGYEELPNGYDMLPEPIRNLSLELTVNEPVLKEIGWNNGRIVFSKSDVARKDITGYDHRMSYAADKRVPSNNNALETINIYSRMSSQPKLSFRLHHSYFIGRRVYNAVELYDTTYLSSRLKLDSITIKGGGNIEQKYKMEYDMSDNLPLKNEYYTDKWGYYTYGKVPYLPFTLEEDYYAWKDADSNNDGWVTIDSTNIVAHKGDTFYYNNDGFESISSDIAKTWTLTKLTSPTGAETGFKYECNDIYDEIIEAILPQETVLLDTVISNFITKTINVPIMIDNPQLYRFKIEYTDTRENDISSDEGVYIKAAPAIVTSTGYPHNTVVERTNGLVKRTFVKDYIYPKSQPLDKLFLFLGSTGDADVSIKITLHSINKKKVGGIRISEIKSPISTIKYIYNENGHSTGRLIREPLYTIPLNHYYYLVNSFIQKVVVVNHCIEFNSYPQRALYNPYNGNHIGYSAVTVVRTGNGKEITEKYRFVNESENDCIYFNDQGTHNPLNGTQTRHSVYWGDSVYKDTHFIYDTVSVGNIRGLRTEKTSYSRCYYITAYHTFLDSMSIKEDENVKSFKYTYHDSIFKLKTAMIYATGHPTKRIEYSYSVDYPSYLGGTFKDSQLKTLPLMEKYYTGNTLEKAIVKTHHNSTIVKPYKEYSFIGNQGLDKNPVTLSMDSSTTADVTYNSYTAKGRVTELISRGGRRVVLLWSYGNQHIVAQINNATLQDVINSGINIDELAEKPFPDDADWNKLHNLRNVLPNAQVTVSRYEPLVGMVSQTDARGVETRYTYDEFNRLHQVIEVVGDAENIIEQIEYHYATEE